MIFRAIIILTSFSLVSVSFAEEAQKVLPTRQMRNFADPLPAVQQNTPIRRPVRKLASVNPDKYSTMKVKRSARSANPDRETDIRLGLGAGLSNLSSGDSATQTSRDGQNLGQNLIIGVNADVRFMTYLGVELDAYYGIAPTQTIDLGNDFVTKKKLQHMGGMFDFKGQLPLYTGSVRWVPKLGLGYGMLSLKQKTDIDSISESVEASKSVKGIYGTVGFDVEPISWLMFTVDYAKSLSASGTYSEKSSTTNVDTKFDGAQFDRIRFGMYFRVDPSVLLGAQYTKRTMSLTQENLDSNGANASSTVDISNNEAMSQIGATILFQF